MDRKVQKIFDTLQAQAEKIDRILDTGDLVVNEIDGLGERLDLVTQALQQVTVTQEEMLNRLLKIDQNFSERTDAVVELCVKTSKRVDRLESAMTPPPSGME
jgi:ABC-type transporter Mla subunit MlaD